MSASLRSGFSLPCRLSHGLHGVGGERGAQARLPDPIVQRDDAVAADGAENSLPSAIKLKSLM